MKRHVALVCLLVTLVLTTGVDSQAVFNCAPFNPNTRSCSGYTATDCTLQFLSCFSRSSSSFRGSSHVPIPSLAAFIACYIGFDLNGGVEAKLESGSDRDFRFGLGVVVALCCYY